MKKFIFGLVLGVMLSSTAAYAGYMFGWTVTIHTDIGDVTCDDPYMSGKELECDGEVE
jgi:hypothetical protein